MSCSNNSCKINFILIEYKTIDCKITSCHSNFKIKWYQSFYLLFVPNQTVNWSLIIKMSWIITTIIQIVLNYVMRPFIRWRKTWLSWINCQLVYCIYTITNRGYRWSLRSHCISTLTQPRSRAASFYYSLQCFLLLLFTLKYSAN